MICGTNRFTYQQFADRVNQLSNALTALNISRGDRVAYLGYNCHRLLEAYYGVPQIGAILVPLNIRLAQKDFKYILQESTSKVLLHDRDFIPQIEAIRDDLSLIERYFLLTEMNRPPVWISGFDS